METSKVEEATSSTSTEVKHEGPSHVVTAQVPTPTSMDSNARRLAHSIEAAWKAMVKSLPPFTPGCSDSQVGKRRLRIIVMFVGNYPEVLKIPSMRPLLSKLFQESFSNHLQECKARKGAGVTSSKESSVEDIENLHLAKLGHLLDAAAEGDNLGLMSYTKNLGVNFMNDGFLTQNGGLTFENEEDAWEDDDPYTIEEAGAEAGLENRAVESDVDVRLEGECLCAMGYGSDLSKFRVSNAASASWDRGGDVADPSIQNLLNRAAVLEYLERYTGIFWKKQIRISGQSSIVSPPAVPVDLQIGPQTEAEIAHSSGNVSTAAKLREKQAQRGTAAAQFDELLSKCLKTFERQFNEIERSRPSFVRKLRGKSQLHANSTAAQGSNQLESSSPLKFAPQALSSVPESKVAGDNSSQKNFPQNTDSETKGTAFDIKPIAASKSNIEAPEAAIEETTVTQRVLVRSRLPESVAYRRLKEESERVLFRARSVQQTSNKLETSLRDTISLPITLPPKMKECKSTSVIEPRGIELAHLNPSRVAVPPLVSPLASLGWKPDLCLAVNPVQLSKDDEDEELAMECIEACVPLLKSTNVDDQYNAAVQLRKLLSVAKHPLIDEVLDSGAVPLLVKLLSDNPRPQIQFEVAWALTNIASGSSTHVKSLIKVGAVPRFVELLTSRHADVVEQATWALGNIAGDSAVGRDAVLEAGGLEALQPLCSRRERIALQQNLAWAISNLCRGTPGPSPERIKCAVASLRTLLKSNDAEVLKDTCWGLSYLADDSSADASQIQMVVADGLAKSVVSLLKHSNETVQTAALRVIANVVTGSDKQTQVVIEAGALQALRLLLSHPQRSIRKETCWCVSNILAGTTEHITAVVSAGMLGPLVDLLQSDDLDIRKEATWALSNATSGGAAVCHDMVALRVLQPLIAMIGCDDPQIVNVVIEGLDNILSHGWKLRDSQGKLHSVSRQQQSEPEQQQSSPRDSNSLMTGDLAVPIEESKKSTMASAEGAAFPVSEDFFVGALCLMSAVGLTDISEICLPTISTADSTRIALESWVNSLAKAVSVDRDAGVPISFNTHENVFATEICDDQSLLNALRSSSVLNSPQHVPDKVQDALIDRVRDLIAKYFIVPLSSTKNFVSYMISLTASSGNANSLASTLAEISDSASKWVQTADVKKSKARQ